MFVVIIAKKIYCSTYYYFSSFVWWPIKYQVILFFYLYTLFNRIVFSLTLIKAKLEQVLEEPTQALQTYKTAFAQCSILLENESLNQYEVTWKIGPKSNKLHSTRQAEAPQATLAAGSVHSAGTADTRTTHRRNLQSNDDILNFGYLLYYCLDILKILCPLQLNHKQDHNSILSTLTPKITPVFF